MGHTENKTNFTQGDWRAWQLAPDSDPQERSIVVSGPDGAIEICGIINNPADVPLIAAAKQLFEELSNVECIDCEHPLHLHIDQYGCEHDRGDGYRTTGSEVLEALGPCGCKGGELDKAIAALRKAVGAKQ